MRNPSWRKKACAVVLVCAAMVVGATAQVFSALVFFDGPSGDRPVAPLVEGLDGNFYGTTFYGGVNSDGTIFRITSQGGLATLYSFCSNESCTDGAQPAGGLLLGTDGNFYGTTQLGGANNLGTVFSVTPGGMFTTLHSFSGTDGALPAATLIQATDGNLYGTTFYGGSGDCQLGCGTVFRINYAGKLTTLHSFTETSGDGAFPYGGLVQAADADLYGTTFSGGINNLGTIFRVTPTGALTILHSFNRSDGEGPEATLIQGTDGSLYGTTEGGGTDNDGTVFKISRDTRLTTLHNFDRDDGQVPTAGLVLATDGVLYGATMGGGSGTGCVTGYGCGTLFSVSGTKGFATLHNFSFDDGLNPFAVLFQATNGTLYGTASQGGLSTCDGGRGCGTVFSLDIGLGPFVTFVRAAGKVGQTGGILGQGFTGTTDVSLNGIPASFTVVSDTLIKATVPGGATTGYVTVTTPSGTLKSNVPFHVIK